MSNFISTRQGFESNTLRFMAKILCKDPIQAERRFVVSYFLSDDTINIHEPPIRNSGRHCLLTRRDIHRCQNGRTLYI
jgi:hypothetical protein